MGRPLGPDARSVGEILPLVVKKYGLEEVGPAQKIMDNWSTIVGENFADRCAPRRITHDGKLVIQVTGATARQELAFRRREIVSALKMIPECRGIKAVTFIAV
ncbi:MAG: DUF721 domain-containing protein [Opitutales bacterium]